MPSAIDRYWHVVADEIRAGRDDLSRPTEAEVHRKDIDAYAALRRRWRVVER
jgi:hypothetical protein